MGIDFFIMATRIPVEAVLTINGKQVKNNYYAIAREVKKLREELKKSKVGTKEFQKTAGELRKAEKHFEVVKTQIFGVRKELSKSSKILGGFLKSFGGFRGLFDLGALFSAGKTVKDLLEISDAITNVEKTSGLATEKVGELWHELSEVNTRTSKMDLMKIAEIGGRLGINDKDELREFTKEIDKAYIALGDSFEGGLDEVTTKLGKMKNLFKDTSDLSYPEAINRVGSALNELAAKGTSSEQNISDFATRVGQLPEALKPAIDKTLGLGAAFEESGIDARVAGSGYSRFITVAASNIPAFAKQMKIGVKEANALLNTHPEEFFLKFSESMNGLDAGQTASVFKDLKLNTLEIQKAVGAAGQNANRFREMMKLSSDAMIEMNSLTNEANKKNNNSAAIWTKIFKTIKDFVTDGVIPDLFDSVSNFFGYITGVSDKAGNGIQKFRQRLTFLVKVLAIATTSLLSYRFAKLLLVKVTKQGIQQTILENLIEKVSIGLKKVQTGATLLFSAAKYALTGNIQKATAAMRLFNMVTKLSPVGLLLAVVSAATVAYTLFSDSTKKVRIEQQALNDAEKEAAKQTAVQANNANQLLKSARDNTKSLKERQKAVDELNRTVPEYNGNLTVESANTLDATNKLNKYIKRLKDAAREKYLKTLVDKKAEEIAKAEYSSLEDNIKWYERLWNTVKTGGNVLAATRMDIETAVRNKKKWIDVSNKELDQLNKLYKAQKKKGSENNSDLPKEGTTKVIGGVTYVFKNGKWQKLVSSTSAGRSDSSSKESEKALELKTKTQRKLLALEQQLQDEKRILQEDGLAKEIEGIEISYERKKQKILQENEDIQKEISKTNDVIADLLKKKANTKDAKKQADYNDAIKAYQEVNQKRVDAKKINDAMILQLEQTKLYKIGALREKAFTKELNLKVKEFEATQKQRIAEINAITSFEEAKEQLSSMLSKKELSKIKTITQAKEALRKEANKRYLQTQLNFLKVQQGLLQKELQTITDPKVRETLLKNLNFLSDKLKQIKGSLQLADDETSTAQTSEYEQLDILGFSAGQWEETFSNLEKTEDKLKAVGMAMQALGNAGAMYAQLQRTQSEKELQNFTSYQEKRKKALKSQLDNGLISQEKYAKSVEKLDKELANKKAEIEYKQAKAEKTANIFKIIGNTALGVTKALTAPWPMNIVLAAIVGAMGAVQLGIASAQPLPPKPSYAKGGYTKGLGFTDETGHEVAGAVHANEYVIPEWMLNQPRIANVAGWLEAQRTQSSTGFADGGSTTENITQSSEDIHFSDENISSTKLSIVLNRLSSVLEKIESNGIEAFLLSDAKNGKEMHRAIKEFQKLQNKNKR